MASSYILPLRRQLAGFQALQHIPRSIRRPVSTHRPFPSLKSQPTTARRVTTDSHQPTSTSNDPPGSSQIYAAASSEKSSELKFAEEEFAEKMSLEKTSSEETPSEEASSVEKGDDLLPRAVQVAYMRPLKRTPTHGLPVCDLQLRSYSVRNVEFMADFALRAAYYLKLPASGPVPLPKLVKRWTVPRSNFAHKKSQENFERVTLRRLIQIKDANPETVQIWLAYLRKHAFHGVGMKANIWHHEKLEVGSAMDANSEDLQATMEQTWSLFGRGKNIDKAESVVDAMHTDKIRTAVEGTALKNFHQG